MAGVTNAAFRSMLAAYDPALIYSEMVSDKAINYRNERSLNMLKVHPEENNVVLQLFGSSPETITPATEYVSKNTKASVIDLNVGCPVTKVIKAGAGSVLMNHPDTLYAMIKAMKHSSNVPISVKIRAGYDGEKNAPQIAKLCEDAGASLIAIHGRTRSQQYKGNVDLDIIKAVKNSVSIPVIGNGDIDSPESAQAMIDYTGVDAVMVGRALRNKPWLIAQINDYLNHGHYQSGESQDDRLNLIIQHAERLMALKGEHVAMLEMRTHAPAYLKGMPGSSVIKRELTRIDNYNDFYKTIEDYRQDLSYKKPEQH